MSVSDADRNAIEGLDRRRVQAIIEADVRTLSEIFDDALVYNHSSGGRDTKASLLEKIGSGHLDYTEIENRDQEITVAGQTAVVCGRMVAELKVGGAMRRLDNKTLSVWTMRDGNWKFLAFQPTPLQGSYTDERIF